MTPNRSLFRAGAVTGVAAFLFSFAHVSAVAAQTRFTTEPPAVPARYAASCSAQAEAGVAYADCSVVVPQGKRFIIESATVTGRHLSSQNVSVVINTGAPGAPMRHHVPAGFQILSATSTYWSGALPGTIFSESGAVSLGIVRGPDSSGRPWFVMTLSGYLEDLE